ncbi:hypothetical protein H0H92_000098 [Tricholoma furcatifolium]|nr:hypothetical protein H0H92_000098 [Tricholoma furcatifolium]
MSRSGARASTRARAIAQQIMSASTSAPETEEWSASDLCGILVGRGMERAPVAGRSFDPVFCAGGDVKAVLENATNPKTRPQAIDFFKREFELDFLLATLTKPYISILDGLTLGGGAGLAAYAPLRIATERTVFGMPETKIGYCPDVGGNYFLSRLDGELGTYLALTGGSVTGRDVFDIGFATHYVPSRRIPILLDRLASLDKAHITVINNAVEEFSAERSPDEKPYVFSGDTRAALDYAFRHNEIEEIFQDLETFVNHSSSAVSQWAKETLEALHMRSPTSLKVALKAIRKGKTMSLLQTLEMELKIAAAFCNEASPDFKEGITTVLVQKRRNERPAWSPSSYTDVSDEIVSRFFAKDSQYFSGVTSLSIPQSSRTEAASSPRLQKFALPTEDEIGAMVRGSHSAGGATGINLTELVTAFENIRRGKMGVREKVLEVAKRRCIIEDNGGDGNFVWLKWKHQAESP